VLLIEEHGWRLVGQSVQKWNSEFSIPPMIIPWASPGGVLTAVGGIGRDLRASRRSW
jgi:hypothetical protein